MEIAAVRTIHVICPDVRETDFPLIMPDDLGVYDPIVFGHREFGPRIEPMAGGGGDGDHVDEDSFPPHRVSGQGCHRRVSQCGKPGFQHSVLLAAFR